MTRLLRYTVLCLGLCVLGVSAGPLGLWQRIMTGTGGHWVLIDISPDGAGASGFPFGYVGVAPHYAQLAAWPDTLPSYTCPSGLVVMNVSYQYQPYLCMAYSRPLDSDYGPWCGMPEDEGMAFEFAPWTYGNTGWSGASVGSWAVGMGGLGGWSLVELMPDEPPPGWLEPGVTYAKLQTPPVDTDQDGLPDAEETDTDGDGIHDHADTDDDGDGIPDETDPYPLEALDTTDTDGNGVPDSYTGDVDNDGWPDGWDPAPNDAEIPAGQWDPTDGDGDGMPDVLEDDDGDGTPNWDEVIPGEVDPPTPFVSGQAPLVEVAEGDGEYDYSGILVASYNVQHDALNVLQGQQGWLSDFMHYETDGVPDPGEGSAVGFGSVGGVSGVQVLATSDRASVESDLYGVVGLSTWQSMTAGNTVPTINVEWATLFADVPGAGFLRAWDPWHIPLTSTAIEPFRLQWLGFLKLVISLGWCYKVWHCLFAPKGAP